MTQTQTQTQSLNEMLAERGSRYGSFDKHAEVTQLIKKVFSLYGKKWGELSYSQKESLEMIAHKIGRILNGDPNYSDSWHDIAGYAKLVADDLDKQQQEQQQYQATHP